MKDYQVIKEEITQENFNRIQESKQAIIERLKREVSNFTSAEFNVNLSFQSSVLTKINGFELSGAIKGRYSLKNDSFKALLVELEMTEPELMFLVQVLKSKDFNALIFGTENITRNVLKSSENTKIVELR